MSLHEFFARLGEFVAYLGGASVVILGFSGWIGTILSNKIIERAKSELQKEVESHKTSLKKSEFLFEKQYAAASEFIAMRQGFLPKHYIPEMDWGEACEAMAHDLDKMAKTLGGFIARHGAAMSKETVRAITHCVGTAEENQFGVTAGDVSDEARKAVDEIWDKTAEVEDRLRAAVWEQSKT